MKQRTKTHIQIPRTRNVYSPSRLGEEQTKENAVVVLGEQIYGTDERRGVKV